jgi:hypothetical protein
MVSDSQPAAYVSMPQPRVFIFSVVLASLVFASSAAASCVPMTAAQQRARANIIFSGVALDGPTATDIERFRVIRYLKGTGPRIVRLGTGRKRYPGGGGVITSVSIDARRGETWRIYARRLRPGIFQTTVCDGSRRLR